MIFERIYDHPPFSVDMAADIAAHDPVETDLVLSFSSVGHDPSRTPSPEFVRTATQQGQGPDQNPGRARRALFIMDASRSWANDPGFDAMLTRSMAIVQSRARVGRTVAMGLSMGAFSALASAQFIPVDAVLAFGPQWSPSSAHMPQETRWAEWRAGLRHPLRWPTAPIPDTARTWSCLFHGLRDDHAQAMAFPQTAGVDHLLFPELGHSDLVTHLKAKGVLGGLVDAALAHDRRRLLRIISTTGGKRRDRFWDAAL